MTADVLPILQKNGLLQNNMNSGMPMKQIFLDEVNKNLEDNNFKQ